MTIRPLLAVCVLGLGFASSPIGAQEKAAPQLHEFESDRLGFFTKTYFYDNGEEVVAIDSQFTPEHARKAIEFLKTKTKNPITYLIVTHPNIDKFNAIAVYQELGAKVVASSRTAEAMPGVYAFKRGFFLQAAIAKIYGLTEENFPKLGKVDVAFKDSHELRLKNGEVVQLRDLSKPGMSIAHTVVYVPTVKAVFVGDLIHHKVHAWMEGCVIDGKLVPKLKGWIADLNELKGLYGADPSAKVYGGRGGSASVAAAVDEQIRYLTKTSPIVQEYIASLADAAAKLQDIYKIDDAVYKGLQERMEKAFPDYQHSFLTRSCLRAGWRNPGAELP